MNWLDKLERKFGHLYIPQLMNIIVAGQALVWVIVMLINQNLYYAMMLTRDGLAHFQLWRLVSFVFLPPISSALYLVIELYFLWFMGSCLERAWGSFRLNVYFLLGMLGTILSCLLTGFGSSTGLFLSLFFAFAWLFPDTQILLFFILPVKAKWMGWAAGIWWAYQFIVGGLYMKVSLVLGLAGFLLFFGRDLWHWCKDSWINYRRRKQWKNQWK